MKTFVLKVFILTVFAVLTSHAFAAETCRSFMFSRDLVVENVNVGHIAMGITSTIRTGYFAGKTIMFFGSLNGVVGGNGDPIGEPDFTFINDDFDDTSPTMLLEEGSDDQLMDFARGQGYTRVAIADTVCNINGARASFLERMSYNGFYNFTGVDDRSNYLLIGANCLNASVSALEETGIPMPTPESNWLPIQYFYALQQYGWRLYYL